MRKFMLIVVAAASLTMLAPPSVSARHTVAHRVSALERKVSALQRKLNTLHTFTHNCLARDWAPIGWYGDVQAGAYGYVYDNDALGPQPEFYTSALDIAPSVAQSTFVIAIVDPGCVSKIAAPSVSAARELTALKRGLNRL
jgi:hypothetical protein